MLTAYQKRDLIDTTAKLGSVKIAIDQLNISYSSYCYAIEDDPKFQDRLNEAENFYTDNLNRVIATLAKKKLYDTLREGVTEVTTKNEEVRDTEGNTLGNKMTVTKKYKGVPLSAIRQGLKLIPPIEESIQALAAENLLPEVSLQKVIKAAETYQVSLQEAINGEIKERDLDDKALISAIQAAAISNS